jgi:hypothetical protein
MPWALAKSIIQCLRRTGASSTGAASVIPESVVVEELCHAKAFSSKVGGGIISLSQHQQITKPALIRRMVATFPGYFLCLVLFSVLSGLALVGQPFFNNFLRGLISRKFESDFGLIFAEIVATFLSFKLATAFIYVVTDYLSIVVGVKIHGFAVKQLVTMRHGKGIDCNLVACLEEDCERMVFLLSSFFIWVLKVVEFVVLLFMLISKLPSSQEVVGAIYMVFLGVVVVLSYYSLVLNLKIMALKQRRINFLSPLETIL